MNPNTHKNGIATGKDGSFTGSVKDVTGPINALGHTKPKQSAVDGGAQPLSSAPGRLLRRLQIQEDAPRTRNSAQEEKGENVPRTRQAGGPLSGPARSQLSWWRAGGPGGARGGRGQRQRQGRLGILPPGRTVIPVSSLWLLGSSLLALRQCAAALAPTFRGSPNCR